MRNILFFPALFLCSLVQAQTQKARIKIDIERQIGSVDSMLYGNFTEHLGRCIYGGIYEPSSPKANANGFRSDVLEATKDLHVTQVRWPGGNFVSGYHWMDGIGPRTERPKKKDLAWGAVESNQIGTDEFMQWASAAQVEPYVCVNLGTGSIEEARNWVEYCNAPQGLYYSDLRAKNGHASPYQVKYWGLGNEMDGPWQIGHLDAEDYSKKALEAAKLMKWSDNSIKLIASGSSNYGADWQHWNRTVINALFNHMDYISLHHYAGDREHDHLKYMASLQMVDNVIGITQGMIHEAQQQHRSQKPIYIAFDEYNVWYRTGGEEQLEEHYNLQDALAVATYLNIFIRHADVVKMANLAQLVNVIAPMMITNDSLWKQPTYYPLQLFSANSHGQSLDVWVDCPKFDAGNYKQVPYLDVSAVYNAAAGEIVLNVVNRDPEKAITTDIINQVGKMSGKAQITEVNSASLQDENSVSNQKVKPVEKSTSVKAEGFKYTFPAHSYTMIRLTIKP